MQPSMNAREFGEIMARVASAMGASWSAYFKDCDGKPSYWGKLTRDDGLTVGVSFDDWKRRGTARPHLPADARGRVQLYSDFLSYEERSKGKRKAETGFSLERDPKAIARDILNRTVKPYEAIYPEVIARTDQRKAARARMLDAFRKLALRFGDLRRVHGMSLDELTPASLGDSATVHTSHRGGLIYSVTVQEGDRAEIKLNSVPFENLDRVIALLEEAAGA